MQVMKEHVSQCKSATLELHGTEEEDIPRPNTHNILGGMI